MNPNEIRLLVLLILCSAVAVGLHAQSVPGWMNELPKACNGTVVFVRESGEGHTVAEAENQALARVMQTTANRIGQPYDGSTVTQALQDGKSYETLSRLYNIPINKVDRYAVQLKDGTYRYRVWVLCQVAAAGNVSPVWCDRNDYSRTGENDNWTSLAKSAVLPGLGQMGKGHVASGVLTLTGEVALAGTGIGCYVAAQNKLDIMRDATASYDDFTAARDSYNTLRTASYAVWSAAGVLYIYNLVRAYTMQPRRNTSLALAPSLLTSPTATAPTLTLTYSW